MLSFSEKNKKNRAFGYCRRRVVRRGSCAAILVTVNRGRGALVTPGALRLLLYSGNLTLVPGRLKDGFPIKNREGGTSLFGPTGYFDSALIGAKIVPEAGYSKSFRVNRKSKQSAPGPFPKWTIDPRSHLERVLHIDEEGEVNGLEDLLLVEGVLDLLQLDHLLLIEDLHRVEVAALLVFHQHHPAERARAQGLDTVEVVQRRRVLKQTRSAVGTRNRGPN